MSHSVSVDSSRAFPTNPTGSSAPSEGMTVKKVIIISSIAIAALATLAVGIAILASPASFAFLGGAAAALGWTSVGIVAGLAALSVVVVVKSLKAKNNAANKQREELKKTAVQKAWAWMESVHSWEKRQREWGLSTSDMNSDDMSELELARDPVRNAFQEFTKNYEERVLTAVLVKARHAIEVGLGCSVLLEELKPSFCEAFENEMCQVLPSKKTEPSDGLHAQH